MKKVIGVVMAMIIMNSLFNAEVQSQTRDRAEVDIKHTWNLSDMYPAVEAWSGDKEKLASRFSEVLKFKGKLSQSSSQLLECLKFNDELAKLFTKLAGYASMKSDEDTRDSKYRSMRDEMSQLGTKYRAMASFIEPELVLLDKSRIDSFIKDEPALEVYRMYLNDIQRRKTHKLPEAEEKILANAGMIAEGPYNIFSVFANAEMPYPEAELSDGSKVKLNQAGYGRNRSLPVREDRIIVFRTYWDAMNKFRGTFGAQLYSQVKKDMFYSKSRHYGSSLEAALDVNNIPVEVYHSLIKNVNDNLDGFFRYLGIKKRMLGVDTLKYHDLYAPVVKGVDLEYSIDEAWEIIMEALKPMGEEYCAVLKRSRDERWTDIYPTTGKRSGAYSSNGGYDVHPYMLLNYNGKYQDLSTLAHELGHSMHTYYSNKSQPFPLTGYSIFVAEVASTFNEALLTDYILKKIKDDNIRLSLLMAYLDGIKGTVFRQTQFAEYELAIHETAEQGIPLTGDKLTEIYGDILKRYYGHEAGVCDIEDYLAVEWSSVPHFYYNFYVYQYATSFTASTALAQRVINNEKGGVENMLKFLSSGGSDYPIEILRKAGVDMTTSLPFEKMMERMNFVMDEIEKILDRQAR